MTEKKRSNKLIYDIENPGTRDLMQGLNDDTDRSPARDLARGAGALLAAPAVMYKDLTAKKLSDEDKNELRREVTRGNKGEDRYKKGGSVKGWGKARGARAAKVY